MKTNSQQLEAIKRIMQDNCFYRYSIHGKTYDLREDLKNMGCKWDNVYRAWVTSVIPESHDIVKYCKKMNLELRVIARKRLN